MYKKVTLGSVLNKKELVLIALFFLCVLGFMYRVFFTLHYYKLNAPVTFEVKKGESFSQIANSLYLNGVIPGKSAFKIAGFLYGAERRIKPARYYIPNGLSYLDLLDYFINGKADFLKSVFLFPASTSRSYAARLKVELFVDPDAFLNEIKNRHLLDSLGVHANSFEGYLLPQEYDFYENSSPREIICKLYKAFHKFYSDSLKNEISGTGRSLHNIITMASIVNGETNKKEEMPVIAGVYYNRLRIGMKLQADPTLQFLFQGGWRRLMNKDLQINSPYNTYKFAGLPPGPINNPGKAAIWAAVFPEKHDYFYFVADGKGGHIFARNYSEHLRNVDAYKERIKNQ
jgi:UPF0755 protein